MLFKIIKNKEDKKNIYRAAFSCLVNGYIPDKILDDYLDEKGDGFAKLQGWVVNNMRGELMDWCTGVGIIEAVEHFYETALENGNIVENLT